MAPAPQRFGTPLQPCACAPLSRRRAALDGSVAAAFCGSVAAPPSARLPRLTAAMASRLSGALRLAGLDDYIAPSQVGRGRLGAGGAVVKAGGEVGGRWRPPGAVRGRGHGGGAAPMGASRPYGCWALAGLGPAAWAQGHCHGHRAALKGH